MASSANRHVEETGGGKTHLELTWKSIPHDELLGFVQDPDCGASVLFLGTVREMTDGRRTVALNYEAYPEMALAELKKLIDNSRARWPLRHIGVIHRLGSLDLGEVAVAIAVSSPHRAASFAGAQFLMDEIKKSVPIWKQERWADGETEWVHPGLPE